MQIVLLVLVWLPLVAILVGGYTGGLFAVGDSLSVFRLEAAAGTAIVSAFLLMLGAGGSGFVGLGLAIVAAGPIVWSMREPPSGDGLVLYQKNLLHINVQQGDIVDDIRAVGPDIVTLQELSPRNEVIPAALLEAFPHQADCAFARVGKVAVLSRWPIEEVRCDPASFRGLIAARVATPSGPIWIASVHLHWPWPEDQPQQVALLLPVLEALEGPVVLAGDFNMVSWSRTVGRMSEAIGGTVLGPSMITRVGGRLRLRIDHVIAPNGSIGAIERRGLIGSDHHGLVARIEVEE